MNNQEPNATHNPEVMAKITGIEKRLKESFLPPQVREDLDIEIIRELKKLKPKIKTYATSQPKTSRTSVRVQRTCYPNSNGILVRNDMEKKQTKKRTAV